MDLEYLGARQSMSVLDFAEGVAREAAARALSYYRQRELLAIERKQPLDLVTAADRDVERLIRERIRQTFPEDAFFGEESTRDLSSTGRTWVVDPIDGTLNFVRGIDDWAVSIGVLERSRPIAGVVALPARGMLVAGGPSDGARCNGTVLTAPTSTAPREVVVGIGLFASTPLEDQVALVRGLVALGYSFRRNGSTSVSLAMLARGQLDGFVALDVAAWDVAAGMAIVGALGYECSLDWGRADPFERIRLACALPSLLSPLRSLIETGC
jgi:myo-inositol-1(or 4)-monophosphatase